MTAKAKAMQCPCGSGNRYSDCCEPYITDVKPAPTAESLMRSRYSAYCLKHADYLMASWHASTRPESIDLESDKAQWIRLKIVAATEDTVEFIATFRLNGKAHKLHERSQFAFEDGRWYYLSGDILD